MADIVEYSKSKEPLKKREEVLFQTIDYLDKESYELYCEIMDLGNESIYKTEELALRINDLMELYNKVKEAYEYLVQIEFSSYNYAVKRHQTKEFLILLTTFYTFMASPVFGIAAFVVLNRMATKSFVEELAEIEQAAKQFDIEDKMNLIHTTIDNSFRILNGKVERCHATLENEDNKEGASLIVVANIMISLCLTGGISKNSLSHFSVPLQRKMADILQKDLNVETSDLNELIDLSRKKEEKKFIKQ